MKRLSPREGYDLYARDYRKDHAHLDSFMPGAETEVWGRALDELLADHHRVRALDLGCGDGRTLGRWRRRVENRGLVDRVELWGADLSPRMLEAARGRVAGVTWAELDLGSPAACGAFARERGRFELLSALFLLVHLPRPEDFFRRCADLAAPGARLVMNSIPQPAAPELRASGKPIVIEAYDHDADEVEAAGREAGWSVRERREFAEGGQSVSTLWVWELPG